MVDAAIDAVHAAFAQVPRTTRFEMSPLRDPARHRALLRAPLREQAALRGTAEAAGLGAPRTVYDVDTVLCRIAAAVEDITPFLVRWQDETAESAQLHLMEFTGGERRQVAGSHAWSGRPVRW